MIRLTLLIRLMEQFSYCLLRSEKCVINLLTQNSIGHDLFAYLDIGVKRRERSLTRLMEPNGEKV